MPRIDVTLSDIKEFETIPESLQSAKIEEFSDLKEDKNGNSYVAVTFRLQDPPFEGRKITDNYVAVTGPNAFKFKQLCASAGYAKEKVEDTVELIGEDVTLKIVNELYQGDLRAHVGGYAKRT